MNLVQRLATNIRAFRKARKMSQAEFAEKCDLSVRGYQQIENAETGTIRASTVEKIIAFTGLSEDELFGFNQDVNQAKSNLILEIVDNLQKHSDIHSLEVVRDISLKVSDFSLLEDLLERFYFPAVEKNRESSQDKKEA